MSSDTSPFCFDQKILVLKRILFGCSPRGSCSEDASLDARGVSFQSEKANDLLLVRRREMHSNQHFLAENDFVIGAV